MKKPIHPLFKTGKMAQVPTRDLPLWVLCCFRLGYRFPETPPGFVDTLPARMKFLHGLEILTVDIGFAKLQAAGHLLTVEVITYHAVFYIFISSFLSE